MGYCCKAWDFILIIRYATLVAMTGTTILARYHPVLFRDQVMAYFISLVSIFKRFTVTLMNIMSDRILIRNISELGHSKTKLSVPSCLLIFVNVKINTHMICKM